MEEGNPPEEMLCGEQLKAEPTQWFPESRVDCGLVGMFGNHATERAGPGGSRNNM